MLGWEARKEAGLARGLTHHGKELDRHGRRTQAVDLIYGAEATAGQRTGMERSADPGHRRIHQGFGRGAQAGGDVLQVEFIEEAEAGAWGLLPGPALMSKKRQNTTQGCEGSSRSSFLSQSHGSWEHNERSSRENNTSQKHLSGHLLDELGGGTRCSDPHRGAAPTSVQ